MYQEDYTTACKKDVKLIKKQNKDRNKLTEVISLLKEGKSLPVKYKDHPLTRDYIGSRECHIEPDWLLIYRIDKKNTCIILERTGSHSNLFESFMNIKNLSKQIYEVLNED